MAVHNIPENPRSARKLEDDVLGRERVVKKRNLLQLDDNSMLVDETFWLARGTTRVEDVQGM